MASPLVIVTATRACFVRAAAFDDADDIDGLLLDDLGTAVSDRNPHVHAFLRLMALCNTAVPVSSLHNPRGDDAAAGGVFTLSPRNGAVPVTDPVASAGAGASTDANEEVIEYLSSSPDEEALVSAAAGVCWCVYVVSVCV
jgi:hypothetical protein